MEAMSLHAVHPSMEGQDQGGSIVQRGGWATQKEGNGQVMKNRMDKCLKPNPNAILSH